MGQAQKYIVRPDGGGKLVMLKPENVAYQAPHRARNWWGNEDEVTNEIWKARKELPNAAPVDAPLPEGWKSAKDARSGLKYYWPAHDRSAVTWERPTEPATIG